MAQDNELREAIGDVAQAGASLETVVAITMWGLVGVDATVGRLVLPNNMDRMLGVVTDLLPVKVHDAALLGEVREWVREVRVAYRERNAIIHSWWLSDNGSSGKHWRVDLKPLPQTKREKTTGEMRAVADQLRALRERVVFLGRLANHVGGTWSVFRDTEAAGAAEDGSVAYIAEDRMH